MRRGRFKTVICGIILMLALVMGIRQAHFQSTDSWQREQQEAVDRLHLSVSSENLSPAGIRATASAEGQVSSGTSTSGALRGTGRGKKSGSLKKKQTVNDKGGEKKGLLAAGSSKFVSSRKGDPDGTGKTKAGLQKAGGSSENGNLESGSSGSKDDTRSRGTGGSSELTDAASREENGPSGAGGNSSENASGKENGSSGAGGEVSGGENGPSGAGGNTSGSRSGAGGNAPRVTAGRENGPSGTGGNSSRGGSGGSGSGAGGNSSGVTSGRENGPSGAGENTSGSSGSETEGNASEVTSGKENGPSGAGGDSSGSGSGKADKPQGTLQRPTEAPRRDMVTCSIEILCDSLVERKASLEENMWKYIPSDGKILPKVYVTVCAGSSVYDVLQEVCKAEGIALDAKYTPLYKSYYLRGIGHLYEKQAGDMSGWVYTVNGRSVNRGASSCKVSDGDEVSWQYTCNGKK